MKDVLKESETTLTMSYDGNTGGLTGKSDAGSFTFDAFEKPYAIKSIDPTTGLTPDSTQTIEYTSFNKVGSISENGYEADFIYGSDDQRSRMIVKQNGNAILTRWYPTGSYMKETASGVTKEYTFIGGDAYTAPVAAITQGGTTTYYNLLRDHLGSITHVVSSSGAVVAEYSYDAWGRMRNPATWTNYEPGSEPALMVAGRGFTGHEHLPWFNTINMNGRLYDPLTGMFLSPDNYIQSAENSQNYNRYSYGLNNPLRYSDPSGNLAAPLDVGQAICDYFSRITDVTGAWHYSDGGIGGGSAGLDGAAGWDRDASSSRMNDVRWNGLGYVDRLTGDAVSYNEVYHNYIVPNSKDNFEGAAAQGLITSIQSGGVKDFEGVRVFTLNFGNFKNGAAMTIPGIGIFVGPSGANDIDLLRHEFGHIIQSDKWGSRIFWGYIVPASLVSANRANKDYTFNHMDTWTEWSANLLSFRYFNQPSDWNERDYPTWPTTVRPGIMPPFVVGPFDFKFNWLDK